jgi:hypothetical protein
MTTNHYLAGILFLLICLVTQKTGPIFGPVGELIGWGLIIIVGAIYALMGLVMLYCYIGGAIIWAIEKFKNLSPTYRRERELAAAKAVIDAELIAKEEHYQMFPGTRPI